MSIPALGGGANQALQRLLRETAERALADEQALLEGEDPAASAATARNAPPTGRTVRRRAAGPSPETLAPTPDEAIVVQLGDAEKAERLEVAGGWITAPRSGPPETRGAPEPRRFDGPDIKGEPEEAAGPQGGTSPTTAAPGSPQGSPQGAQASSTGAPEVSPQVAREGSEGVPDDGVASAPGEAEEPDPAEAPTQPAARPARDQAATLDRLLVVLKKSGISFRDAYQVLREINAGGTLPPKAQLRARWAAADPDAWKARARTEQARPEQVRPEQVRPAPAQRGGPSEPPAGRAEQDRRAVQAQQPAAPAPRGDDTDLRRTAVDDVIRDRAWHRANPDPEDTATDPGLSVRDDARPTLQSIVRYDATNQAYIAALTTAEFQRLVTILGRSAPNWFWDLRGHRGLRGLAERPALARLNATRIAGTRLAAWIVAIAGMALLWYLGASTGTWW